ncbi:hypothetical protein WA538_005519 [Blastocystis sp. DL]
MESVDDDVVVSFTEDGFNTAVLNEYAVDLSLSVIDRIERYVFSDVEMQRVVHVRLIRSLIQRKEIETIRERVLPLLETIAHDEEESVLLECIPIAVEIVRLFSENDMDEASCLSSDFIIPLFMSMGMEHIDSVRIFIHSDLQKKLLLTLVDGLQELAAIFPPSFNDDVFFSPIVDLLHASLESHQLFGLHLLSSLSPSFSSPVLSSALPELAGLLTEGSLEVLRILPEVVATLGSHAALDAREPFLSELEGLLRHKLWVVRQSAAQQLRAASLFAPDDASRARVLALALAAQTDTSKWVRQAAKRTLGFVVASLPASLVSPAAVDAFAALPEASEETDDGDLAFACAFTLPGVLQRLGNDGWTRLRDCYRELALSQIPSVRLTLAASLGEVATLVGREASEESLVPLAEEFLESDGAETVTAAAAALGRLLPALGEDSRRRLCGVLLRQALLLRENTFNWRVQAALMREIPAVAAVATGRLLEETLLPLMHLGLTDAVAAVREATAEGVESVVRSALAMDAEYVRLVMKDVVELREMNYQLREILAGILGKIAPLLSAMPDQLSEVTEMLRALRDDPLENVRDVVSDVIAELRKQDALWKAMDGDSLFK